MCSDVVFGDVFSNRMLSEQYKCHFLISGNTYEHLWVKVGDVLIWESSKEKLLGVTIDKNLTFTEHVSNICKKAGRKVTALSTIPHKSIETNDKFYWKVAFLMYTEMVNFRPQS